MSSHDANVLAMGLGSIAAGALIGLGFLIHPTESTDAVVQTAAIAANPNRWFVAHVLILAGLGCMIPALLLLMRRFSATAPRAAVIWGSLAFVGLVSVIAFVTIDAVVFWTLAKPGLDASTVERVFDDLTKSALPQVIFGPALLLNVSVISLAVGLYRSRSIPRWISVTLVTGMVVELAFAFTYIRAAAIGAAVLIGAGFIGLGMEARGRSESLPSEVPTGIAIAEDVAPV